MWWCDASDEWRTRFSPPPGFDGEEYGEWGDDDYRRALDTDELEQLMALHHRRAGRRAVAEEPLRAAWFAAAEAADTGAPAPADAPGTPPNSAPDPG